MTTKQNSFEYAFTEGQTADATSTALSGSAFFFPTAGTGASRYMSKTFTPITDQWAMVLQGGSAGTAGAVYNGFAGGGLLYEDEWIYDANPSATISVMLAYTSDIPGTPAMRVRLTTAGSLDATDSDQAPWRVLATVSPNTRYSRRLYLNVDGTMRFTLYGPTGTLLNSFDVTGQTIGTGTIANVQVGKLTSGAVTTKQAITKTRASDTETAFHAPWTPPPVGPAISLISTRRDTQFAFIGDSTLYQDGNGQANLKAVLTANGHDTTDTGTGASRKYFFYAAIGKAINSNSYMTADANGKTTFDNITDARTAFGGEPSGGYIFNLGSNGYNSTTASNTARFTDTMNYIGSTTPVYWVGIWQDYDLADFAGRVAFNTLFKDLCSTRSNSKWLDWPTYCQKYESLALWNSDNVHMTALGYQTKNSFYERNLPGATTEVPAALKLWNGTVEVSAGSISITV